MAVWSRFRDAVMAASDENVESIYPAAEEQPEEADDEQLPGEDLPPA